MQPFTTVTSKVRVLPRDNVDTDMIIRIERLVLVPRRDLGAYAFEMLRNAADGSPDPMHPLNDPGLAEAQILVTGRNFGSGSSREAAVWALVGYGLRVLIAPSFADIFRSNALKNGILPIQLDEALCQRIADLAGTREISVDLGSCLIRLPNGEEIAFAIAEHEREALLSGEDEVALTLRHIDMIAGHFSDWHARTPWAALDPRRMQAVISDISGREVG